MVFFAEQTLNLGVLNWKENYISLYLDLLLPLLILVAETQVKARPEEADNGKQTGLCTGPLLLRALFTNNSFAEARSQWDSLSQKSP